MLAYWPIRYKALFGAVLLCLIVAILSFSGFRGVYAYRELSRGISQRAAEMEPASKLIAQVAQLQFTLPQSHFGTEFSGRPRYDMGVMREHFETNLIAVRSALQSYQAALEGSTADDPFIGDKRREYETVQEIRHCLERVTEMKNESDWVLEPVVSSELKEELERLAELSGELPKFLQDKMRVFRDRVRGQYHRWIFLTSTATLLTGLVLAWLVRLFYVWVFQPLRILIDGSRQVAAGDFAHRIQLTTHDEVAELAAAMNAMTDRFQQIRDDLDAQVQQRTREVVRSEQLASVGFLAAGVAHEINNPLASIAWAAESLESRLHDVLQPADERPVASDDVPRPNQEELDVLRRYLSRIQDEAFRCKGITERLLDFSRLGDIQRHDTDLREVVQGVIDMVKHLGKHRHKKIVFVCTEHVVVHANAQEMKQVVLNLITNALDSIEDHGTVQAHLCRRGESAVLTVRDNGSGMTEEVLKHLYEPFFTRRRGGQGTGLGLSITYRIVTDHGGEIQATSAGSGQGSQIQVTLPLSHHEQEKQRQQQAA
ncbi:MAG: HAMP domain-containing protein [Planctomycetaceae bacterium]|nr:HAMP domain-containing protein [Planctomycetaceae bacterium]